MKTLISALLALLILANTLIVVSNCCLNTVRVDRDGGFIQEAKYIGEARPLIIESKGKVYRIVKAEFIGKLVTGRELYSERIHVLNTSLYSGSYVKRTIVERSGENGEGFFYAEMKGSNKYLRAVANYTLTFIGEPVIEMFKLDVETNDHNALLIWNTTFYSFLLLYNRSFTVNINYTSIDDNYSLKILAENIPLNKTIARSHEFKTLTGLPGDLDPYLLLIDESYRIEADQSVNGDEVVIKRHYVIDYVEPPSRGSTYYIVLLNTSRAYLEAVIGYKDYVNIDSVNWEGSYANNTLHLEIVVHGRGVGGNRYDRVKSVMENLYMLSSIYGCFTLESETPIFYLDDHLTNELCINKSFNPGSVRIVLEERNGLDWLLYLLIGLATALSLAIVFLILRFRRSS